MHFTTQILFFIGALGAFQSGILGLFLTLDKSQRTKQKLLFGIFLLVFSSRIIKSLFYAQSQGIPVWFLQIGPAYFLLIGPTFFHYILSVVKPKSTLLSNWKNHLGLWLLIVLLLTIIFPFPTNIAFNKTVLLPIINLQWLSFILASAYFVYHNQPKKKITAVWLWLLLSTQLLIWTLLFFTKFEYFVIPSIIFTLACFGFAAFWFQNKKQFSFIFPKEQVKKNEAMNEKEKDLLEKIEQLMQQQRLFTNAGLKLLDVATELDTSPHEISKILNEKVGKGFAEYINEFRINEAKQMISKESIYTLEAIGNSCGFNSKSAFYNAFKKQTGTTPGQFKKEGFGTDL